MIIPRQRRTHPRRRQQKYTERARAQVIGGKCWTVPVLVDGRVYCRNAVVTLVCLQFGEGTA
jgi:hypothetical protein